MKTKNDIIRKELTKLVQGGNAHVTPWQALEDVPDEAINEKVDAVPYSIWELTEHMRIAQWDIIDFALKPEHTTPPWPDGFWPDHPADSKAEFDTSAGAFLNQLNEIAGMIQSPDTKFFKPIDHAPNYTLFRQFMLVADHNAYHTGQIVTIRRILDIW